MRKIENILMKDILNITLEEAFKIYETYGMGFIIRDGKLKGFNR